MTVPYLEEEYGHLVSNTSDADADIVFEMVEGLHKKNHFVYFREPVAYDDESVFWYDKSGKIARVSFENFEDDPVHVKIDSEFDTHFLGIIMEYLVSFKLLKHGACFCHASAIEYHGVRMLFPAWRHAGKTNLMLHFLERGARYVADDWVILFRDGTALPLPKRLHLLYYNFTAYPELVKDLEPEAQALFHFTQRAMNGEHDLNWEVIDELRQKIRYRKAIDHSANPPVHDKAMIGLLVLLQGRRNNPNVLEVEKQTPECMRILTEPILGFEQMHFHNAYAAHKIRTGKVDSYLEQTDVMISGILKDAYNCIPALYELSFSSGMDVNAIAAKIDDILNTSENYCETRSVDTGAA